MFFYYAIKFLLCIIVFIVYSFSNFVTNQNNQTAVWLKLIGMHNEKNRFFCKLLRKQFLKMNSSYIYIYIYIYIGIIAMFNDITIYH